jgi:hypothetical protein
VKITYAGNRELVTTLEDMLRDEGLEVSYYTDETSAAIRPTQIFEVTLPGTPAWMVILTTAELAVSKFRERFPFEGEITDKNTPA